MNHPTTIHVDMDAFYASVEQRDHPSPLGPLLAGKHPIRPAIAERIRGLVVDPKPE